MRISDWSSDVCSSDLYDADYPRALSALNANFPALDPYFDFCVIDTPPSWSWINFAALLVCNHLIVPVELGPFGPAATKQVSDSIQTVNQRRKTRSEEHTSELQSLMRTSYAVFCLKKKQP